MAGRRPKPTALKLVTGNPGRRPLPKDEPKPDAALLEAPDILTKKAVKYWAPVAKLLSSAKLLTELDVPALVLYCEAAARYSAANDQIEKYGPVVLAKSGFPVQSPYMAIANKSFEQMTKIMVEFGMTPASRTRVTASDSGDDPKGNPFGGM